jgi:hypothetical protein
MEFGVRRHHLIEEAKAELDIAYEAVKRAEREIMASEALFTQQRKKLNGSKEALGALTAEKDARQELFGIDELYDLQHSAIQRFSQLSSVFTIVHTVESTSVATEQIRDFLFRAGEVPSNSTNIVQAIDEFACSLRSYSLEESTVENDRKVRESWEMIEGALNDKRQDCKIIQDV